jgi:hypothetical protein
MGKARVAAWAASVIAASMALAQAVPPGGAPVAPGATPPPAENRNVPIKVALERRIPEVRFDAVALSDALDFIRDAAGINVRVDWKVLENAGVDKAAPVTFRLRNITVRKALDMVLREVGAGTKLAFEVEDNVLLVTTQEEADRILVTEVYDIRDLLFTPLDAGDPPALEMQLEPVERGGGGGGGSDIFGNGGGNSGGQNTTRTPDERGAEIAELVQTLIRPEVWQVNGGPGMIRYFNGSLIVTAPRSVHELIGTPVR